MSRCRSEGKRDRGLTVSRQAKEAALPRGRSGMQCSTETSCRTTRAGLGSPAYFAARRSKPARPARRQFSPFQEVVNVQNPTHTSHESHRSHQFHGTYGTYVTYGRRIRPRVPPEDEKDARCGASFSTEIGAGASAYFSSYFEIMIVFFPSFSETLPSTVASLPPLQISLWSALAWSLASVR